MNTENEIKRFLKIAKTELSKFCFMVWDYYYTPDLFDVEVIESTIRCKYGLHNLIHGKINTEIFEKMDKKGELVISTNLDWIAILDDYFIDFKLLDDNWKQNFYNSFYCMELSAEDFDKKESYKSRFFNTNDEEVMSMHRKMHMNTGLGGAGIIENENLITCAFAPHIVNNDEFSFAIIRDVWTKPSHRGRGYAFDASSVMSSKAFEVGLEKVFLWVEQNNKPAVHIYEKMGFKVTSSAHSVICRKKD